MESNVFVFVPPRLRESVALGRDFTDACEVCGPVRVIVGCACVASDPLALLCDDGVPCFVDGRGCSCGNGASGSWVSCCFLVFVVYAR